MLPLQVPASPELLLVLGITALQFVLALVLIVLIYRDANQRDSDHALAWAAGALVGGPVVWVLYFLVRDEIGSGGTSGSG